jgi:hypothetical protein
MSANVQPAKQSKGFAIASLVLGIASIPTFGLFVVGAITGIIIGVIALNKISHNPQTFGGKNLAIAGIITSVLSLILIGITNFSTVGKLYRQTAAINTLRTIHQNQAQFVEMKGHFGTMEELIVAGLVDERFLNSKGIAGYRYTISKVSEDTYCAHADRTSNSSANMDFMLCKDGIIRQMKSKTKGTVKRGEGTPLGTTLAAPTTTP